MKNKFTLLLSSVFLSAAVACTAACARTEKKIRIDVGMWPSEASLDESALFRDCKERFEFDNPQYEVVASPYTYSEDTVVAKMLTGQLPTVFTMGFKYVRSAYNNAYIRDVSAFLNEYGWAEKIADDVYAEISWGGVAAGLPNEQNAVCLLLNLDVLCEAGVIAQNSSGEYVLYDEGGLPVYPTTFDEIESACAKIKAHYGGVKYGLFIPSADEDSGRIFANVVYNFGSGDIEYCDEQGEWRADLQSEAVGDALRWVKFMAQNGYIDDASAYDASDWISKIAAEEVAMAFCNSDSAIDALTRTGFEGSNLALVPMPGLKGTESYSLWGGTVYAFSGKATDEQVEGALKFLKYLGESPDTGYISMGAVDRKMSYLKENGMPVFALLSVYNDSSYLSLINGLVEKYGNVPYDYFGRFFGGVNERKRGEEPYYVKELYGVFNRLQQTMLFQPTSSDLVALLAEEEKAFNERYMAKISKN